MNLKQRSAASANGDSPPPLGRAPVHPSEDSTAVSNAARTRRTGGARAVEVDVRVETSGGTTTRGRIVDTNGVLLTLCIGGRR